MTNPSLDKLLPLTPATFHILLSLAEGVKHGYAVKREVETRTQGIVRLGAGTLYEAIQRLDRQGLIAEAEAPRDASEPNSRWRFYQTTKHGRQVLKAELDRLEADVKYARARALV